MFTDLLLLKFYFFWVTILPTRLIWSTLRKRGVVRLLSFFGMASCCFKSWKNPKSTHFFSMAIMVFSIQTHTHILGAWNPLTPCLVTWDPARPGLRSGAREGWQLNLVETFKSRDNLRALGQSLGERDAARGAVVCFVVDRWIFGGFMRFP